MLKMQRYHRVIDTIVPVPFVKPVEALNPFPAGELPGNQVPDLVK